jgi:hypothetical protein
MIKFIFKIQRGNTLPYAFVEEDNIGIFLGSLISNVFSSIHFARGASQMPQPLLLLAKFQLDKNEYLWLIKLLEYTNHSIQPILPETEILSPKFRISFCSSEGVVPVVIPDGTGSPLLDSWQ